MILDIKTNTVAAGELNTGTGLDLEQVELFLSSPWRRNKAELYINRDTGNKLAELEQIIAKREFLQMGLFLTEPRSPMRPCVFGDRSDLNFVQSVFGGDFVEAGPALIFRNSVIALLIGRLIFEGTDKYNSDYDSMWRNATRKDDVLNSAWERHITENTKISFEVLLVVGGIAGGA